MVEKPIIGKRTGIGQAYDMLLGDMLPIHQWDAERRAKMKGL